MLQYTLCPFTHSWLAGKFGRRKTACPQPACPGDGGYAFWFCSLPEIRTEKDLAPVGTELGAFSPSALPATGVENWPQPKSCFRPALSVTIVISICLSPAALTLSRNQTGDGKSRVLSKLNLTKTISYHVSSSHMRKHSLSA